MFAGWGEIITTIAAALTIIVVVIGSVRYWLKKLDPVTERLDRHIVECTHQFNAMNQRIDKSYEIIIEMLKDRKSA